MADTDPLTSLTGPDASPPTGFDGLVGVEYVSVTPDEVVLRLPIEPHLHQPYGIVHGGVWCSVVETAASVGAGTWLHSQGREGNVVGVSNHTDFLRAARDGEATIRATPIHRGRLQQLWLVEISDATDRALARGQVRLQNLDSADTLGRS